MSSHNPNTDQSTEQTDSAEARMRLALGLGTRPANPSQASATPSPAAASHDSTRQRRRFAQDGDVPVVMLHRGRDSDSGGENKLAALTGELREERAARLKSERALEEANLLVQSLKTKLKHTEMTVEEKLRGESEARAQAETLLINEREARHHAETKAAEAALALSLLERKIEAISKSGAVEPAAVEMTSDLFGDMTTADAQPAGPKRRQSRKADAQPQPAATEASAVLAPETAEYGEDKPIEWWLPSFRAARKAPIRRKRAVG